MPTDAPTHWYLLIHQLPPKPAYLRAKIGHRLARVGGIALKNSVYVLPERDDCLEDFQWIAQEAAAGGGGAYVCRVEFLAGIGSAALEARFRRQATEAYEALKRDVTAALEAARKARGAADGEDRAVALARLRRARDEIAEVDFFGVAAGKEVETMLRALEERIRPQGPARRRPKASDLSRLVGRTWVTRRDPKVDRLASAWLIRRFVDPGARFRFVDARRETPRPGEIGFDMVGGEFTHEGERCTFEVLLGRLRASDPALRHVAEIVHDVDLKDDKFGRPDAAGVQALVKGLIHAHTEDEDRLAAGLDLFDHLYASFSGRPAGRPAGRTAPSRRGRKRPARAK